MRTIACLAVLLLAAAPDDRKAERHVDGPAEREQLHRNQPLIVIAGDDDIELATCSAAEDGVTREGSVDLNSSPFRVSNGGAQNRFVFRPKQSVLARVRIQPGKRETRSCDAKPRKFARGEIDDVAKQIAGQ